MNRLAPWPGGWFDPFDGPVVTGFVVSKGVDVVLDREANGVQRELKRADIGSRSMQRLFAVPEWSHPVALSNWLSRTDLVRARPLIWPRAIMTD